MQPTAPLICPACGTPVSAFGGRCPTCGQELPRQETASRGPRALVRVRTVERRSVLPTVLVVLGVAIAIAALVGAGWYLQMTSPAEAQASASAPPGPATRPPAPPDPMEPLQALADARRRASQWNTDALLVSLEAKPISGGKLEAAGTITIEFGRPKGKQLGPGAELLPERFVVVTRAGKQSTSERRGAPTRGIADPNCPLEEAWRKMVASGVPSTSTVDVRYELHKKGDRAVWSTSVPGKPELARTLDGNNCAIVSR